MQRSNVTLKFTIRFEDGEVLSEKCRDSTGGFQNMMNRLRAHTGAANWGPMGVRMIDGTHGVAAGRAFTVEAVD